MSLFQIGITLLDLSLRLAGFGYLGCYVTLSQNLLILPLFVYPYLLRCVAMKYKFSLQESISLDNQGNDSFGSTALLVAEPSETNIPKRSSTWSQRLLLWTLRNEWIVSLRFQGLICFVVFFLVPMGISTLLYFVEARFTADCAPVDLFIILTTEALLGIICVLILTYLLWNVRENYKIKLELLLLLGFGIPNYVIWSVATVFNWSGIWNNSNWLALLELGGLIFTIYVPLVTSYSFGRTVESSRKAASQRSSFQVVEDGYDDELFIVMTNKVLATSFEKYVSLSKF